VAGGGAGGRLPTLVGRGRAFEILLGGEDFDGALAEKYGWVNRAIADSEFVAFVDAYATRVSKWDHRALSEIKSFINKYTRLPDEEFPLHSDAFWRAAARPAFQSTTVAALDNGLQERSLLEYHLGEEISKLAAASEALCGLIFRRRLDREVASAWPTAMPATEAHVLAATQRPIATIALARKIGVPAWQTIP
jgi:hypothetical protein